MGVVVVVVVVVVVEVLVVVDVAMDTHYKNQINLF